MGRGRGYSYIHLIIILLCTPPSFICYPPTPLSFSHKKINHVVYLYIHPPPGRVQPAFRVPLCSLTPFSLTLAESIETAGNIGVG